MITLNDRTQVPLAWMIGVALAFVAWWANANDSEIEALSVAVQKNADQIAKLAGQVDMAKQRDVQHDAAIVRASEIAEANQKLLIKIAAKLNVETD